MIIKKRGWPEEKGLARKGQTPGGKWNQLRGHGARPLGKNRSVMVVEIMENQVLLKAIEELLDEKLASIELILVEIEERLDDIEARLDQIESTVDDIEEALDNFR